jgi:hypothetical protein
LLHVGRRVRIFGTDKEQWLAVLRLILPNSRLSTPQVSTAPEKLAGGDEEDFSAELRMVEPAGIPNLLVSHALRPWPDPIADAIGIFDEHWLPIALSEGTAPLFNQGLRFRSGRFLKYRAQCGDRDPALPRDVCPILVPGTRSIWHDRGHT